MDTGVKHSAMRDVVAMRMEVAWSDFAMRHPRLAEAIDRVRLVDGVVESLRDDPRYAAVMAMAARDEGVLGATAEVLALVDGVVRRAMGI